MGGIVSATARKISKKYQDLPIADVETLLKSKYHEERWVALGIFGSQFTRADSSEKRKLYNFYLKNTKYIILTFQQSKTRFNNPFKNNEKFIGE